jgi:hypothetical protein
LIASRSGKLSSGKLARGTLSALLLAGFALVGARPAFAASADWQSKGLVKGMWVDERSVPDSGFHEFRVSTLRSESPSRICEAITQDSGANPDEHVRVHQILRETPTERWSYERVKLPSVADRDYVVHMKVDQQSSEGGCEVSFQKEEDPSHPPVNGAVRLKAMRGSWVVAPTPDGKVSVTYQMFTDPGGSIPALFAHGPMRDANVDFFKTVMNRAHLTEEASR